MRKAPLLLVLFLAAAPAHAAPAPALPPLVVFLGDSLTAGLGLAESEAWPAVVGAELAAEGIPIRVVNAGVSGDTTAGGLARLDWLLRQKPSILVVALGGNDGLRGLPTDAMERNLRAIVERTKRSGAKVLLVGMLLPTSHGESYRRAFAAVFPRVAKGTKVPLLPFLLEGVAGVPTLNQDDGIHPTAAGQRKIAATALPELRKLLGGKR
jgi:acyl-CoA thioesterase-1